MCFQVMKMYVSNNRSNLTVTFHGLKQLKNNPASNNTCIKAVFSALCH
jgi:hypothetical protein